MLVSYTSFGLRRHTSITTKENQVLSTWFFFWIKLKLASSWRQEKINKFWAFRILIFMLVRSRPIGFNELNPIGSFTCEFWARAFHIANAKVSSHITTCAIRFAKNKIYVIHDVLASGYKRKMGEEENCKTFNSPIAMLFWNLVSPWS